MAAEAAPFIWPLVLLTAGANCAVGATTLFGGVADSPMLQSMGLWARDAAPFFANLAMMAALVAVVMLLPAMVRLKHEAGAVARRIFVVACLIVLALTVMRAIPTLQTRWVLAAEHLTLAALSIATAVRLFASAELAAARFALGACWLAAVLPLLWRMGIDFGDPHSSGEGGAAYFLQHAADFAVTVTFAATLAAVPRLLAQPLRLAFALAAAGVFLAVALVEPVGFRQIVASSTQLWLSVWPWPLTAALVGLAFGALLLLAHAGRKGEGVSGPALSLWILGFAGFMPVRGDQTMLWTAAIAVAWGFAEGRAKDGKACVALLV